MKELKKVKIIKKEYTHISLWEFRKIADKVNDRPVKLGEKLKK